MGFSFFPTLPPTNCFLSPTILKSKTGLMVARAAALRTNINIDGRPLPPKFSQLGLESL